MSQCSRTARNGYSCPADNCTHSASACISYSRPTRSWPCHLVVYSLSAHAARNGYSCSGASSPGQLHPFPRRLASLTADALTATCRALYSEGARAPRLRRCLRVLSRGRGPRGRWRQTRCYSQASNELGWDKTSTERTISRSTPV